MKKKHQPDARAFHSYYLNQSGRGYPVYAGRRYQRGHGLGSILGGLFKAAAPLLKKGATFLGKEALKTGLNVASDALQGENVGQAIQKRAKQSGREILSRAMGPPGERPIKGRGRKKNTRRRRTVNQKGPRDIFS